VTSAPLSTWRILLIASAVEASVVVGAISMLGLLSGWNGWFDLINQFAPASLLWLLCWGTLAYYVVPGGRAGAGCSRSLPAGYWQVCMRPRRTHCKRRPDRTFS